MCKPKEKLLALLQTEDISTYSYGRLSKRIGCKYPSQSLHYLKSLIKSGVVTKAGNGKYYVTKGKGSNSLLTFPLMGEVSCGVLSLYADDVVQDVVSVSPSQVNIKRPQRVFALRAIGESMNKASINGKNIETGDYVFVESLTWLDVNDGDYVVSIIDGMAVVKKLNIDSVQKRIILESESYDYFDPIIVGADDLQLYTLSGRVVDIVKSIPPE